MTPGDPTWGSPGFLMSVGFLLAAIPTVSQIT
jgi:hypothetical protein